MWIEPVIDRTSQDVDTALKKIREWKSQGNPSISDLKACFNISDINRIEGNIHHLSIKLNEYYYKQEIELREWEMLDIPTKADMDELIAKVELLVDKYFAIAGMPDIPNKLLNYEEVNDIEKILLMIKVAIIDMENSFKKCGAFKCGQKTFLPLKRS